jgi:hypothetical protein
MFIYLCKREVQVGWSSFFKIRLQAVKNISMSLQHKIYSQTLTYLSFLLILLLTEQMRKLQPNICFPQILLKYSQLSIIRGIWWGGGH